MSIRSYILLGAAIFLLCFIFESGRRKLIKKKWLKRLTYISVAFASAIMIFAVVFFPGLPNIETTGEYQFTSSAIQMEDASRGGCKLSVLVCYPDSPALTDGSCPLVIFSHGGIATNTSNISLYEELASHGYIVASIAHTGHALVTDIDGKTVFIDSKYMNDLNAENSHTDIENSYRLFQEWMELRTADISFVIDGITADTSYPFNLADGSRIGVAGHSLGGSAALGTARQRDEVKAAAALESPYMCDMTGVEGDSFTWNTTPFPCAVMNIYSDGGIVLAESDHKYVQNKNYLYNRDNVEYYHIKGSNHFTLTDLVRTSPALCSLLGGGYETPGYDTLKFINEKCLAFFDKYL